jgi:hypothetical protein
MKFGQYLEANAVPEWRQHYVVGAKGLRSLTSQFNLSRSRHCNLQLNPPNVSHKSACSQ